MSKKTILIAEDHSLLRAGLRMLLQQEPENEVIGEADNGRDAIRLALALSPDLVLMDLTMPGTNGLEAIAEIRKRLRDTRILVLTIHKTEEYIREALRAGADGYVLKDAGQEELLQAVRAVLQGRNYLSPELAVKVIGGHPSGGKPGAATPWDSLSQREREVLKLVAEGCGNKYIAQYLSLSVKTVEKHRSSLMRKLDLHSTAALTAYAIEKGLIEI
jgi:DNA-binding NarL/FixJ family response regulator